MKTQPSKSSYSAVCTWVSPEGKVSAFETEKRLLDFHTKMLTNNPYVKEFSFKRGIL